MSSSGGGSVSMTLLIATVVFSFALIADAALSLVSQLLLQWSPFAAACRCMLLRFAAVSPATIGSTFSDSQVAAVDLEAFYASQDALTGASYAVNIVALLGVLYLFINVSTRRCLDRDLGALLSLPCV